MKLDNKLLDIKTYIKELAETDPDYAVNELFAHSNKEECLSLINEIDEINVKLANEKDRRERGKLTSKKGKALEYLAKASININNLYKTFTNIKCDSNEIDVLAIPASNVWTYDKLLPDFMTQIIIIECKNYNKSIDVTWTGKLYSLIKYKNVKAAVMFSYYPLSGIKEWEDAKGLVKKIYLKDDVIIINITVDEIRNIMNDVKEIQNDGTNKYSNIVVLIKHKINELQFHTDFGKIVSKHPAEKNKR